MADRANACSELTRFWLEVRHGCVTTESVPVSVPYASSDIDLVAMRLDLTRFALPDGTLVGPRLIVETKDEHDWEPTGAEFGGSLRSDVAKMSAFVFVPAEQKGIKFTMLRQQHYEKAVTLFATQDFDRLFVVHAIDPRTRADLAESLAARRIYVTTIREVVADIEKWYRSHPRPATLRHTMVGDLLHLLFGFCGLRGLTQRERDHEVEVGKLTTG
jgi:hypothetical protein